MPVNDALLFIDANKFLDLYRTDKGKKLLAPLGEQVDYIFVTQQIVDEVQRNKISVAAEYLGQKFRELKLQTFSVPDHLSGTSAGQGQGILQQMREIGEMITNTNAEVDALALGIVEQISRNEDEVSKALGPIFAKAASHSPEELQRARYRRELGNPPGKNANPIGDQLTWEQILTHFKGKKRLWIISRDGDYGTVYYRKGFVNRLLYDDLCRVASLPEIYLFEDLVDGIKHFVETTGVQAAQHLTPEETQEIEEEEKSLPQLTQPTEETRRTLANLTRLTQPSEDVRRAMAEMAKLAQPSEDLRRMMAETVKFSETIKLLQPNEELRRTLADMARLTQPSEDTLRAIAKMTTLFQPSEDVRRMMVETAKFAEAVKLSQPSEGVRQILAQLTKPYDDLKQLMAELNHPYSTTKQSPTEDREAKDIQHSHPQPKKSNGEEKT